jgi:hypothetical protein
MAPKQVFGNQPAQILMRHGDQLHVHWPATGGGPYPGGAVERVPGSGLLGVGTYA